MRLSNRKKNRAGRTGIGLMISLVLIMGGTAFSTGFSNVGTSGFVFLQLPATARYAALGETGITLPDFNAEGVFINPALLARSEQTISVNLSYASWYVETSHQAAAVSYMIPQIGTIGLQMLYFDFGDIQKTRNPFPTETGSYTDLGEYSAGGLALGFSFARMLTRQFAFGATLKYVRESIDASHAENIILDLGFLYETGLHSIRVGAFLQNFGLDAKYIDQKFKMPQLMKMGISAEIWGELIDPDHVTALIEVVHPNDVQEHIQFGLEGMIGGHLALRTGYKFGYDAENLTLGMGVKFDFKGSPVRFDASYMNHEYLQSTLRFTLGMEF